MHGPEEDRVIATSQVPCPVCGLGEIRVARFYNPYATCPSWSDIDPEGDVCQSCGWIPEDYHMLPDTVQDMFLDEVAAFRGE